MKLFYSNFEDLFERFSIMTIDGNLPDETVIRVLSKHTTPELIQQLKDKVRK